MIARVLVIGPSDEQEGAKVMVGYELKCTAEQIEKDVHHKAAAGFAEESGVTPSVTLGMEDIPFSNIMFDWDGEGIKIDITDCEG